ncbi:MAG: hypothetical protein PHG00_06975 [Methylococcales bacterium]|nr:hypothetical protein [Methylococcales bacterium]
MAKRKHRKRYPTDLNARKWSLIRALLPAALPGVGQGQSIYER